MSMFCIKCGAKNEDDVKFCEECGHGVGETDSVPNEDKESVRQKKSWRDWVRIGFKTIFVLILLSIVWSIFAAGYYWYQNQPREVNELAGISLGMKPVDITLSEGKPSQEIVGHNNRLRYLYSDYSKRPELFIKFGDSTGAAGVITVCSYEYYDEVFGLGKYDSLDKVLNKLGEPTGRSISSDGTQQLITYSQYNVAFVVSENKVKETCVTSETKMSFVDEY